MAARDFSLLILSDFPQAFDSSIAHLFARVDRILAQAQLSECDFSDEHCDCRERATVHHLASEQEFCERHFQAVTK